MNAMHPSVKLRLIASRVSIIMNGVHRFEALLAKHLTRELPTKMPVNRELPAGIASRREPHASGGAAAKKQPSGLNVARFIAREEELHQARAYTCGNEATANRARWEEKQNLRTGSGARSQQQKQCVDLCDAPLCVLVVLGVVVCVTMCGCWLVQTGGGDGARKQGGADRAPRAPQAILRELLRRVRCRSYHIWLGI